jgi:hypothetical protein
MDTDYSVLIRLVKQHTNLMLELGAVLYNLKTEKAYEEYAEKWSQFLADPEVSLTAPFARDCIKVYQVFYVQYEIENIEGADLTQVPWQKLVIAAKYADGKELDESDLRDLIGDAESLSRTDLDVKLGNTKESDDTQKPNYEEVDVRVQMPESEVYQSVSGKFYKKLHLVEVQLSKDEPTEKET